MTCEVKFPQLKQVILHSLIHNTPAVIKGISMYESDTFQSMMALSKNKEMKENDNEKFSASLNTEINESKVSPFIKNEKKMTEE
mgnify:CR=1 FL=1